MRSTLSKLLVALVPALALSGCGDEALELDIEPVADGHRFTLRWTPEGGPRTLLFPSGKRMDVVVETADGERCWRWSEGRMFTMALSAVTLAAGETFEHSVEWDGRCADGEPAPPGEYVATAEVDLARLDDEPLEEPITVSETFELD